MKEIDDILARAQSRWHRDGDKTSAPVEASHPDLDRIERMIIDNRYKDINSVPDHIVLRILDELRKLRNAGTK